MLHTGTGYVVRIPATSSTGMPVALEERQRGAMQQIHAETADQSTIYFEITAYPPTEDPAALVEQQRAFLQRNAPDATLSAVATVECAGQAAQQFDFSGTLQERFKRRRFWIVRSSASVLRIVCDPYSAENLAILAALQLG